jgi:hypothetical protein
MKSILKSFLNIFLIFFIIRNLYSIEKVTGFDLYEPGIFNPLGPTLLYGDSDIRKRPYMLIALNEKNQILEKSLLQYDNQGRLIGEKIFDVKNRYKGEIQYIYNENGKIIEEKYNNENGNLIAKKVRHYNNNVLVQIDFYDRDEYIFSRKYIYEKDRIIGREFQKGASDPFIIKLKNGLIESIEFKEKNNTLMEIKYQYKNNHLVERIKQIGEAKFRCEYKYDQENRLQEYIYYDFIKNSWKKSKIIQFVYADQV